MESMHAPRADEAIVFDDFFTAGLRMPPHPVLLDILHKFWV
jgi:tRNA A37 threonylcarbamoyladenosine synthetase subunit TsaC/SUA5/YrdC